jgi:hypothetical protein
VSEPVEPDPAEDEPERELLMGEALDDLPVLAGPPRIVMGRAFPESLPSALRAGAVKPAVQAAAVAAGGFVAGAAVVGLVHRHQQRSPALRGGARAGKALARAGAKGSEGAGELMQAVQSRRFLVDVHLLGGPSIDR